MENSISLSELISPWLDISASPAADCRVQNLVLDSRQISSSDTFVAIVGHAVDGRKFIERAIESGANAVLAQAGSELEHGVIDLRGLVPIIYLAHLDHILSALSGRLYKHEAMQLIGITGTNGKTTISQLIAQWLELIGERAAVMGTTGNGFLAQLEAAKNTTGSAIDIQRTLAGLSALGAGYTALEVSSHGLVQGRVKALSFAAGVFTNLSRDHLDYHGTMEAYALAKKELFAAHQCQHAIINADDPVGRVWLDEIDDAVAVSLAPLGLTGKAIWASEVSYSEQGITLNYDGCWGTGELKAGLIGQFNASNLLLAFATLLSLGFPAQRLLEVSSGLKPVIGRMELFQSEGQAKIVVDYAHTPDALEKALQALRVHCQGQLWAIFGCGGERDKGKRPMMAAIGERLADRIILSDDNPRSEDPAEIIQDMLAGLDHPQQAEIKHDRYAALESAVKQAGPQDIILLAGKGHEDYQVFADQTVHFSDRESAQQLLGIRG